MGTVQFLVMEVPLDKDSTLLKLPHFSMFGASPTYSLSYANPGQQTTWDKLMSILAPDDTADPGLSKPIYCDLLFRCRETLLLVFQPHDVRRATDRLKQYIQSMCCGRFRLRWLTVPDITATRVMVYTPINPITGPDMSFTEGLGIAHLILSHYQHWLTNFLSMREARRLTVAADSGSSSHKDSDLGHGADDWIDGRLTSLYRLPSVDGVQSVQEQNTLRPS